MRDFRFIIYFLLLIAAQMMMCNYFNLSQFILITILPAMILCTPIGLSTTYGILIAFATGFLVDFFSTGMIGLTSMALMPVALLRNVVINLVFGEEVFARNEDISFARQGVPKMALATFICTGIYFAVFIMAESAGTRPLWADLLKYLLSSVLSTGISLFAVNILSPERSSRW